MHVIATAGHVDHGKSTLIRALTGMEPDRWAEEQRRGMTIDLGYAWTTLDSGRPIAFVDVPGHRRFITNMLAGVGPVPAVLFVVAADQGWSAQSAEHLDALEALGVRHGVLAITRADLGDAELAEEEARTYLDATGLAGVEAVAVSPVAGVGLEALRAALDRMVTAMPPPAPGPARLWVDRVFTIRGAGTVVTGTLASGSLRLDEPLEIRPYGNAVRVRRIQSLMSAVDAIDAVARVGLNLPGVKAGDVRRGHALTAPGHWADVSVVDVRLTTHGRLPERLVLHVGSAAVPVHARVLGGDAGRLSLATPLPLHVGDRGVLRDPGAAGVVAGAIVLDTIPLRLRRRGDARRRADELAVLDAAPAIADEVRRRRAVRRLDLVTAGVAVPAPHAMPDSVVATGPWLVDRAQWRGWQDSLGAVVGQWAAAHPMQPGMARAAVVTTIGLPADGLLDALVAERTDLVIDGLGVRNRTAVPTLPVAVDAALERLVSRLRASPFEAADAAELEAAGLTEAHLALAVRADRLVRVGPGVYLLPDAFDEAISRLGAIEQPFTISAARVALGTSRRVAVPLLESLDRLHRTQRVDADRRTVRR